METFEDIYLLLGTNLGNRLNNLTRAQQYLEESAGKIIKRSSVYETKAWGKSNQPDFLNQVIILQSHLNPGQLLDQIHTIENQLGRIRKEKWGERFIDIDILYYKSEVTQLPHLTIPHPEIQNRRFTLVPLCEIASNFIHPVLNKTQLALLETCTDHLPVIFFSPNS